MAIYIITLYHAMKTQKGNRTQVLEGREWFPPCPDHFTPAKSRQPFCSWLVMYLRHKQIYFRILCLWLGASLIYINNCPTRCNTKQSIYYSASSFYMFRVSTTPIIRSTQNCNYSLRYWSYFLCSYVPPTWPIQAVVTVLCTPDDECGWHPKHVEWTCRIINRLLCVAPRWKIMNISDFFFLLL